MKRLATVGDEIVAAQSRRQGGLRPDSADRQGEAV